MPSPGWGDSTHKYLPSKYLQGLLEGRVHRVLLDSGLAFSLGGSVRQQIGLHIPRSQMQAGQGTSSEGVDESSGGESHISVFFARLPAELGVD